MRKMNTPAPATPSAQRNAAWAGSWATLRDLEVFLAVIEMRKTTAAAHRLGVSQPAISRTLASFEQKSGRQLFRHEGIGLVPTADALALYERIRPIFDALEGLRHFDWNQPKSTVLRLACPPTMAQCWIEEVIAAFHRINPDVQVSLEIVTTPEVLELVADQRADLGVADVPSGNSGLLRSSFRRSQMMCVLPAGHALAKRRHIDAAAMEGQPLIMLAKRNPMRPSLEQLFKKAGCVPNVVLETTTSHSALQFVARGAGITLINPFPALITPPKNIVVRPFVPSLAYEAAFFTSPQKPPSTVVHRFIEFARQQQPAAGIHGEPIH
jgi:DNA-binding transcriptional LysR family regulator